MLHNWGEPALNKDFPVIIKILSQNKLRWNFSTNASVFPQIANSDFSLLSGLTISMPGFSQSSYDKIHGFNFDRILKNIDKYAYVLRDFLNKITIYFHAYQFNIHEIHHAYKYASKLKVNFFATYAYFNNYDMSFRYLNRKLSGEDIYDASKQLALFYVDDLISNMPQEYICPQFSILTLDEFGNVLQCCCISRTQKYYSVGSIFDITLDEIIENRKKSPACVDCLNSGIAYWAHNPFQIRFCE